MNQERLMKVLLAPIVSEKATLAADRNNQYAFRVATDATKQEIDVKVDQVQVVNLKGKTKRTGKRAGRRKDTRKAYVRLIAGQEIDLGGGA